LGRFGGFDICVVQTGRLWVRHSADLQSGVTDYHGNRKGEDSVFESSACGLFVMSKGFKEAKIYVNSEFDLRRVLHEAASIFRIYDRWQPRPYTLG
jgi:hypothetical protein